MAEWINVLFGLKTSGNARIMVLNRDSHPTMVKEKDFDTAYGILFVHF